MRTSKEALRDVKVLQPAVDPLPVSDPCCQRPDRLWFVVYCSLSVHLWFWFCCSKWFLHFKSTKGNPGRRHDCDQLF